jgi:hypothetical protein
LAECKKTFRRPYKVGDNFKGFERKTWEGEGLRKLRKLRSKEIHVEKGKYIKNQSIID